MMWSNGASVANREADAIRNFDKLRGAIAEV